MSLNREGGGRETFQSHKSKVSSQRHSLINHSHKTRFSIPIAAQSAGTCIHLYTVTSLAGIMLLINISSLTSNFPHFIVIKLRKPYMRGELIKVGNLLLKIMDLRPNKKLLVVKLIFYIHEFANEITIKGTFIAAKEYNKIIRGK